MKNYPLFITSDKSEYNMFNLFIDHEKVMPLPTHLGEIPNYVNGKQYNRILKMREKRSKKHNLIYSDNYDFPLRVKKKYKFESRHQHATTRQRDDKGRFLKKDKLEKSKQEHDDLKLTQKEENKNNESQFLLINEDFNENNIHYTEESYEFSPHVSDFLQTDILNFHSDI